MAELPRNVDWIADFIPALSNRVEQFTVDTDEVDDELIEVFLDELKRLTGVLQDGLVADNAELVRTAAHSIKGMGGTIGLPELSVLALEIETLAKEDCLENSIGMIEALVNWMKTVG